MLKALCKKHDSLPKVVLNLRMFRVSLFSACVVYGRFVRVCHVLKLIHENIVASLFLVTINCIPIYFVVKF